MGFVYNVTKGRTEYLIGLDEGGAGGGGVSKKKIIIKSDVIPEASAKTYKLIYIYAGPTSETYTHGYIYECIADENAQSITTDFVPEKIGFDFRYATHPTKTFTSDVEAMTAFITDILKIENPYDVVSGKLVVDEATITDDHQHVEMWYVYCYDKNGQELLSHYKIYASDLQAYGFQFAYPPTDYSENEPINFTFKWVTSTSNYRWNRLDVQPGSSGGTTDYTDLTNKPQINGVTLNGNNTSDDLELQNMSVEVKNSGDTLPVDTTGYSVGDKFLNTTDKKVYEVVEGPAWDNGTTLVDNTQYIDVENDILWLYNDNKLIQLNSLVATINFYDVNNWTLDVTKTQLTVTGTLGNSVYVFKNGQLIQGGSGNDYTISGSVITFVTALEDTDKVAVINGNLTGIDLTPYLTANDLLPYQQKSQIIENSSATVTNLAIEANKVYKLTNANITNISFASCEKSELVTKIDFTTGSSDVQFSDGNVIDWADGETPHFYAYQHYWIIISNGVGFVKEIY